MKSCPFDGGMAAYAVTPGDPARKSSAVYKVQCTVCGAHTSEFLSSKEALDAWNARSGLADASPLVAWIDLHSGVVIHTASETEKPKIHGFNLKNEGDVREHYRLSNWKLLSEYFRKPQ